MTRTLIIMLLLFGCSTTDNKATVGLKKKDPQVEIIDTIESKEVLRPIRVKAMTSEITEDDTIEVTIKARHYTLYPDGKIAVRQTTLNQTDTFHLKTELTIETAYIFDYKDDLVIYYADTDFESGASYIECYDRKTNKMKWKNDIHGFNLTEPIIVGNLTYVASIGFIGKLNLDNGQYFWKHDGLYETTKFNAFGSIEIHKGKVNFIESLWVKDTRKPGRIIVDDQTGIIEKTIKNVP